MFVYLVSSDSYVVYVKFIIVCNYYRTAQLVEKPNFSYLNYFSLENIGKIISKKHCRLKERPDLFSTPISSQNSINYKNKL